MNTVLGWDKGRDVAIDFVVTHPLQAGLNHSLPQVSNHLRVAEARKISENLGVCTQFGWDFAPAGF
jgi:hypothetical protein